MKTIFTETSQRIPDITTKGWDDERQRCLSWSVRASARTIAHYDDKLRVLIVDQEIIIAPAYDVRDCLWRLPPRRLLETLPTRAAATRRAIELADEYFDRLSRIACDDDRSDDEVRAAYQARYSELAF